MASRTTFVHPRMAIIVITVDVVCVCFFVCAVRTYCRFSAHACQADAARSADDVFANSAQYIVRVAKMADVDANAVGLI